MKINSLVLLTLLLPGAALPGHCAGTGMSAAAFLGLPAGVRGAALGGAVCAGGGGMELFDNPAAMRARPDLFAAFSHAQLMADLSFEAAYAAASGRNWTVGAGAQQLSYGDLDLRPNTGVLAGTISPSDRLLALGLGLDLGEGVSVGAAGKRIESKIYGTASASALDLGLHIKADDFSAGLAIQNMGQGLKFQRENSPLPFNVKLGTDMPFRDTWHWSADLNFPRYGTAWLAAGGEYAFRGRSSWTLFARAGYNSASSDTGGINGFSAGFGLAGKRLTLDYALRTMGVLGLTHQVGLSWRLGSIAPGPAAAPQALPAPVQRARPVSAVKKR